MPRRPGPMSPAQRDDTAFPPIHLARDHPEPMVRERLTSGSWTRVRRGAYVDTGWVSEAGTLAAERRLALARVAAVRLQSTADLLMVRGSAALVWGLPLRATPGVVHVAQWSRPNADSAHDVARHTTTVPDDHRCRLREHLVTTLERTVVDCAAAMDPLAGLVVADAALHRGADRDAVVGILGMMAGSRGVRRARAVVDAADGGAESAGETWARWSLLRLGLPAPQTQVRVETAEGTYWADMGYPEWRLLCEYDGASKYGSDGEAAVATVMAERRRQLALEEAGWRVLRLTSADRTSTVRRRLAPFVPATALTTPVARPYLTLPPTAARRGLS